MPNPHPLQVDPGVGFLCTLEGFGFVSGWPFPDNSLVRSRSVLSSRARDGFDIAADQRNDFSVGDRSVSVVARRAGCFRYSAGVCVAGAIYRMWNSVDTELVVTGGAY